VISPSLYGFIDGATDTTGRQLFTALNPQNASGTIDTSNEGIVGRFGSLTVVVSHALEGQGKAIVCRPDEWRFYELARTPQAATFEQVGSGTHTARLAVFNDVAVNFKRRPSAAVVISGTGITNAEAS
jgi:hypothetical protein